MSSIVVLIFGAIVAYIGIGIYGRFFDRKVIEAKPDRATPAVLYADGVD